MGYDYAPLVIAANEKQIRELQEQLFALRHQLAEIPREEIAALYDAYAFATARWEPGKAEHFPAVLRYLIDTQGAE